MKKTALPFFVLLAGAAGCSTGQVMTGSSPHADLSTFRTYAWVAPERGQAPTKVESAIKDTVSRELARKGLAQAEPARADLLVSYYAVSQNGMPFGAAPQPWHWPSSDEAVSVKEGALTLELIDPKTSRAVWQGVATGIAGETEGDSKQTIEAARQLAARVPVG